MNKPIRMGQSLTLLTVVMVAVTAAVCWVAGCAKKSGREAVPEIPDTLTVTSDTSSKVHDTLSETRDTLLITHDTLPEIPNTLTDKRDGQVYKTVTIGKQTWMGENLHYWTPSGSWCYDNDPFNCGIYGRLYDWNTAKTVCPTGWHLSSREEWDVLAESVGGRKMENEWPTWSEWPRWHDWDDVGKKLKSTSSWYCFDNHNSGSGKGTDEYGFSALAGGSRYDDSYSEGGYWWTATEYDDGDLNGHAYYRSMGCHGRLDENIGVQSDGFSVRCVKDRSATGALPQKSVGDDTVGIEMAFVKGGTFMMGCTGEQGNDCFDDEKPAHSVTVSDFYIGKYEVTQNQLVQVMGSGNNLSDFKGGNLPVENVSWKDAHEFILRLNTMTGKKYRLPTEAEWEYAARGGASSKGYKYSGSNSGRDVAWYNVNSGDTILRDGIYEEYIKKVDFAGYDEVLSSNKNGMRAVGTKAPNELGIYDMSGNVREWVNDWYGKYSSVAQTNPMAPSSGPYRVFRGGNWYSDARSCRVSFRGYAHPDSRSDGVGFRLVLSP